MRNAVLWPVLFALVLGLGSTHAASSMQASSLQVPASGVIGVTDAQLSPDFWIARLPNANAPIMTRAELHAANGQRLRMEPSLHDLATLPDALSRRAVLDLIGRVSRLPRVPVFDMHGQPIPDSTLAALLDGLALDRVPEQVTPRFGLIVDRASLRALPTEFGAFTTRGDIDIDRFQETAEFPGTPVAVVHETADGQWLFVISPRYAAWTRRVHVALGTRAEVLAYAARTPFRVVTGARVETVETPEAPQVSRRELDMTSRVPLAIPLAPEQPVNGQAAYAGWMVELPIRKEDGTLGFQPALIQKNADTAAGYLPYTRANLIRQAFKFLGERYGWGHLHGGRDCSGFISEVFGSMGLLLPRNTGDQARGTGFAHRLFDAGDSHAARLAAARALQVGDRVYIPGHVLLVIGRLHGQPYVIHDVVDLRYRRVDGGIARIKLNSVAVTPLLPLLGEDGVSYVDRMTSIVRMR